MLRETGLQKTLNFCYTAKMNFPKIAFKIEDRVYRLDASDGPAIKNLPQKDREHLITLFMAIKKQHDALESNELKTDVVADSAVLNLNAENNNQA
jgi:hypothetical protein